MNIKKFLVVGLLVTSLFGSNLNGKTPQENNAIDPIFQHKIDILFIHFVEEVIKNDKNKNKTNSLEKYNAVAALRPLVSDKGLRLLQKFLNKDNIASIDEVMNMFYLKQKDNA